MLRTQHVTAPLLAGLVFLLGLACLMLLVTGREACWVLLDARGRQRTNPRKVAVRASFSVCEREGYDILFVNQLRERLSQGIWHSIVLRRKLSAGEARDAPSSGRRRIAPAVCSVKPPTAPAHNCGMGGRKTRSIIGHAHGRITEHAFVLVHQCSQLRTLPTHGITMNVVIVPARNEQILTIAG